MTNSKTPPKVTIGRIVAVLKAAGFKASVRTQRTTRSGCKVRQHADTRAVNVFWNDFEQTGDGDARFNEVAKLTTAIPGLIEGYTNPMGRVIRVWPRGTV